MLMFKAYGKNHKQLSDRVIAEVNDHNKVSNVFEVVLLKNNVVVSITSAIGLCNAKMLALGLVEGE